MKASDLFVRCLEAERVRYIFGLPGEEIEDLLFSLQNSSIKLVTTRHEQGAAFMADVWGRLTGQAGVCLTTLGPGATNLITGLADAHLDKSPVVAITGQGALTRLHKEGHQLIDMVSMMRPITKWNTSIHHADVIAESVRKAFKVSEMEKPGVTHLELPEDVARVETAHMPITPNIVRRPAPDHKALAAARDLIVKAHYPVIVTGNGAIRKLASKHLRALVTQTGLPVIATFMGKGALSDRDPHSLGTMGLRARDYPMCALERADIIITIGFDVAEYDPAIWNPTKKPIIHIDFNPAEVYEYYPVAVEVVADISATLWELCQRWDGHPSHSDWYRPIREAMLRDHAAYVLTDSAPFTTPGMVHAIRNATADTAIIISDVGAHKMWLGRNLPVYEPGSCIISNGFASMGIAVPGGIAARLAFPERQVVALTGDGGFLMNSQELETAVRLHLPYVIVLVNDNDYGLISWKQQAHTGDAFGTAIGNPDFLRYVESFGARVFHPRTPRELTAALTDALAQNVVSVVVVDVDPSVNLALTKKLTADICPMLS